MEERQRLIEALNESYTRILGMVSDVDPDFQVNSETDWMIRDVIAHLAVWDREVAKSIRAFQRGEAYAIPDFAEDTFNDHELQKQRKRSAEEVFALWERERREFVAAVEEIPSDRFSAAFLYPWGDERGNVGTIVEYMIGHDVEHRDEIEKALSE